jgi:hypothetical protein
MWIIIDSSWVRSSWVLFEMWFKIALYADLLDTLAPGYASLEVNHAKLELKFAWSSRDNRLSEQKQELRLTLTR